MHERRSDKWVKANFLALLTLIGTLIYYGVQASSFAGRMEQQLDTAIADIVILKCHVFGECNSVAEPPPRIRR